LKITHEFLFAKILSLAAGMMQAKVTTKTNRLKMKEASKFREQI
jgi:hypothetical protein